MKAAVLLATLAVVAAASTAPAPKGAPRRAGAARNAAIGGAGAPAAPALTFAPLQTERMSLAPGLAPVVRRPATATLKRLCAPGCVVCGGDGAACVVCAAGHAMDGDGACKATGAPVEPGAGAAACPAPHCDVCEPELGCVACAAGHYLSGGAGCVPLPVADAGTGRDADEAMVEDAVESVAGDVDAVVSAAADAAAAEESAEDETEDEALTALQAAADDAAAPPCAGGLVDNAGVCHPAPCPDAGPRCAACEPASPGVAPGFRSCAACAAGSYAFLPSAWGGGGGSFGVGVGVAACHACARLGCAPGACADGVGCTACPAGSRLAATLTTTGVAGACAGGGCPANCVPV